MRGVKRDDVKAKMGYVILAKLNIQKANQENEVNWIVLWSRHCICRDIREKPFNFELNYFAVRCSPLH